MVKKILIFMLVILLVGTVTALDKSNLNADLGLDNNQIAKLENAGIKNIELIEYPCQEGYRCFAVDGDIKEKLIEIPLLVKDNCIQNVTTEMISKFDSRLNRTITMGIKRRDCSGIYNYRETTEDEIQRLAQQSLNKKLSDKAKENPIDYYPIPEGVRVETKQITIGKSIGGWVGKLIGIIGGGVNEEAKM